MERSSNEIRREGGRSIPSFVGNSKFSSSLLPSLLRVPYHESTWRIRVYHLSLIEILRKDEVEARLGEERGRFGRRVVWKRGDSADELVGTIVNKEGGAGARWKL